MCATIRPQRGHGVLLSRFAGSSEQTKTMRGMMMQFPLTLTHILERGGRIFPEVEIISRVPLMSDGQPCATQQSYAQPKFHRYSYGEFYRSARCVAGALRRAGIQPGDRVGTLMWN